jgi:hypothetical protein
MAEAVHYFLLRMPHPVFHVRHSGLRQYHWKLKQTTVWLGLQSKVT